MLDNRAISDKQTNPNNSRAEELLEKRFLKQYSDETSSSILGFNKLLYHPEKLVGVKNRTNVFPITATLSVGNYCNHGCKWCSTAYFRESTANKINYSKISSWLEKASKRGLKGVGYVGNGEPLAFKLFADLANKVAELNLDQGIFTNGFFVDKYEEILLNHFTYVRISLDAGSKEVHSLLHDTKITDYDKIISNLKNLIEKRGNRKNPTVGVQFATHQQNINDLEKCARMCVDIGVDYLSIKPVFNRGTVGDKIEKNTLTQKDFDDVYRRVASYENADFKVFYRPQQVIAEENQQNMLVYKKCFASFFGINLYENGDITGCGPHHVKIGDLDTDLDTLENNIKELVDKLDLVKCPSGCRYHPMNYQIHKIINNDDFSGELHSNLL
tara:strand:+ start:432 stop:1589 length:1158 start_codon:yes stop_codon:yes gene_type:complete